MNSAVTGKDPDERLREREPGSLREALARAREENLNLLDEVVGARAAAAQARKDHDATFYLLDVTTRQLNELKAALGYRPQDEVADIVHAVETLPAGVRSTGGSASAGEFDEPADGATQVGVNGATGGLDRRLSAVVRRLGRGIGRR